MHCITDNYAKLEYLWINAAKLVLYYILIFDLFISHIDDY